MIAAWQEIYDNLDGVLESKDITLPTKVHIGKAVISCSHVERELDHKEGRVLKNWCFQTVVLEKTPESLLYCKEIQTVNPIGNKPRIFIGRIDTEAEAPILWSPDVGKDWGQEEKGATEYEMVGWYHWLNGHEFAQTQGDSEGQGSLYCCSSCSCKESDMT